MDYVSTSLGKILKNTIGESQNQFSSAQFSQLCPTLCDPMDCSTPGFCILHQLPELAQIHVHCRWCHPTISSFVIPFSSSLQIPDIRVFSNESALHIRWPKYWSFSFSISPSNEYSGLTSFRMDRLDLLAVQGILKSLLQHHSSKASILPPSFFFTVQHSHPYMTTGKTIALTRQTFVGKITSLLLNMLSRLVITFLPRSKHLLILWPVSPFAMILEPKKPVFHCFHCFPTYSERSDGTRCHDLSFLNVVLSQLFYSLLSLSSRGSSVLLHSLP